MFSPKLRRSLAYFFLEKMCIRDRHGTGKVQRVLAFVKDDRIDEALAAGADYAGNEEYAEKIQKDGLSLIHI